MALTRPPMRRRQRGAATRQPYALVGRGPKRVHLAVFPALGSPSAMAVIRKTTSASLELRQARMRMPAGTLTTRVMRSGIVDMEWDVGTQGLAKWIIGIGMEQRTHRESKDATTAKGLTGSKGITSVAGKGAAGAEGPMYASSCHTARGKGILCLLRAWILLRVIVRLISKGVAVTFDSSTQSAAVAGPKHGSPRGGRSRARRPTCRTPS